MDFSIKLEQVNKFYGKAVLTDFSHTFDKEGITCLLGESGCGKTTLLRILGGLTPMDTGSITGLQGKRVTVLFQEDRLLPWVSAFENVVAVSKDEGKAMYLLEKMGLGEDSHLFPGEMSGGMKRRVAIARALAHEGDIFLMDEPFTGIDTSRKEEISNFLKDQMKEKLCIMVLHQKEEAFSLTDCVYVMRNSGLQRIYDRE